MEADVSSCDLTGMTFGRLTVVDRSGSYSNGNSMWLCKCTCGSLKRVRSTHLKCGRTRSCGCLRRELSSDRRIKHGCSNGNALEYNTWCGIIERCTNPNSPAYKHYGGRGIKMCDEWRNSFQQFINDVGVCSPGLTLDRIDVNGNYEPGNCRWATWDEQARNRRNNRVLEYGGKKMVMTDWASEVGLSVGTLWSRLDLGWPTEKALTKPLRKMLKPKRVNNQSTANRS